MNKKSRSLSVWLAFGATLALASAMAMSAGGHESQEPRGSVYPFTDVQAQTFEFHAYNRTIELTSEQEAVMRQALTGLKAPCCADRTALTCCCKCNMAKSWWGLSKHLIANEGRGAEEVRTAVVEWFEFINPDGFSGTACYIGRCGRPFRENGCGGMDEGNIVF